MPRTPGPKYVNVKLISQLLLSQALVFGLASVLSLGGTLRVWAENDSLGFPFSIVVGVVAVLPLLALNKLLESSESPTVAPLNLSTDLLVLSMFGPTSEPLIALFTSLALCSVSLTSRGCVLEQENM